MSLRSLVVAVFLTVFFFLATPVAQAKPTEESILSCGSQQYVISGWGTGAFHVSGSNQIFLVTYARLDSEPGQPVLFDIRGQQNKPDIVTCTTTSPVSRIDYTFKGFFTPRN